ncbi:MAG TPA: formimidoylglutamate deiminase [Rhizomicrobium sp.]
MHAGDRSPPWFEHALLPGGWTQRVRIAIASGRIAAIDSGTDPAPDDERHAIALPGMPNLHSHAFQRGMAGFAETRGPQGDSFWTWREIMYRFVEQMGPDELEAIAAMAYIEMLEAGFTRAGEFHYVHHDPAGAPYADRAEMAARIAAAAEQSGIGLTLLPVFYAHAGFGGLAPKPGQRRFIHNLDEFEKLLAASRAAVASLDDAVTGLAPHSLRAATEDELRHLATLAGSAPIHIHVAEQQKEVNDCLAWSGRRPVEWLLDTGLVDDRWCLVHATHITGSETAGLAKSGAVAGLCPITEANLGDGVFPAVPFLSQYGRFGIGSDSNVLIDAAEELRTLEYGQRLMQEGRNVLASAEGASTGGELYRAALRGGAQALQTEAALRIGAPADLVSLNAEHPALYGRRGDAILDSWIFAARAGAVDCVWRHGRKVVADGRHHARDEIVRRYRRALDTVLA